MDRTSGIKETESAYGLFATGSTSVPKHSCTPSHETKLNDAAIEDLDGCEPTEECEQVEAQLTDVNDLLKIEHWKPAEPQFCKDIAAHYQQSKRAIQKWFVDLREIAPWFDESELRLSDDRYTPLAVELLGDRYFAKSKKKWTQVLAERFDDRIAAWQNSQSCSSAPRRTASFHATASEKTAPEHPSVGFISPLDLSQMIPLDVAATFIEIAPPNSLTVKSLANRQNLLVQGQSDLESVLSLMQQVEALTKYVTQLDEQQNEIEEQQIVQLEEAEYALRIHQQCLRRHEIVSSIRRSHRSDRRKIAAKKLVDLRETFAKTSQG